MKHLILKLEPVIWLLFGQGIMIGTMLLTGWLLIVCLAVPLGIVDADALSYQRAHMLGSNIVGRLVLVALIALPMWKGAHHCRHLSIDHGGGDRDHIVAPIVYSVAAIGSIAAILAVIRL
jgi:fumarate reductase subunit D